MSLKKRTILLAFPSGNIDSTQHLVANLRGFNVIRAADVESIQASLQKKSVDLLIFDEDLEGVEACLQSLDIGNKPGMIVVICQKDNINHWESQIPDLVDEFFRKPIRNKKLLRIIRLYMAGKNYEQYEAVFNAMPFGGEILDSKGQLIEVSKRTCKLLGYKKRELIGKQFSSIVDPADIQKCNINLQQVLKKKTIKSEISLRHKNGKLIPVLRSARLIHKSFDPKNPPVIIAVNLDISNLIRARDDLITSEKELLNSQKVGGLGSFILDIEKGTWTSTQVLDEIFGVSEEFVKDLGGWSKLVTVDDRQMMMEYFLRIGEEHLENLDKTFRIQRNNDEQIRWVHGLGSVDYDITGVPAFIHGTIQDVTSRVESEAEMRKLSYALQQTPATIIITDTSGNIEYVNAKFSDVTGYSVEEVVGKNPRILSSGEKTREDYKIMWDTICAGDEWQGEFHNKKKNGDMYWEFAVISPIRDHEGNISQFLAVKEDITQSKIDAEKRRSLQDQLNHAQRMEAIGTLAGGIAHDFNNILQSMYLYLGMAHDALPDGDTKDDIAQVTKAALRAKDLVNQILTYSRGSENLKSNVLIQFVVKESLKLLKASFPISIEIKSEIDGDCPPVLCDPTQVHQIVMNICTNAFDALPGKKGTIEVNLRQLDLNPDMNEQLILAEGHYLELTITDSGQGIPPATLPLIFNPFFSTKEPGKGSGLGLSVVHGIMEDLGGQIIAESEEGNGTTFSLYFPITESETDTEESTIEPLDFDKDHILLLETEEDIREGTQLALEKFGCKVTSSLTSEELLKTLSASPEKYTMVIANQHLHEMSGLQLAELVKKDYPQMPFMLMSGNDPSHIQDEDHMEIIDGFIRKPWQIVDLIRAISELKSGSQNKVGSKSKQ